MPESRRGATTAADPDTPQITRTFWPPTDWSLRRKVVACLALPLVFATVLVGIRVAGAWNDARDASQAQTRYQVLQPAIDYLASSQDLAAALVVPHANEKTVGAARAQFQQSRETLQSSLGSADLSAHQHDLLSSAVSTGRSLDSATDATSEAAALAPGAISSDVLGFVDDLNATRPESTLNALHDLVTAQSHLADQRLDISPETKFSDSLRTQMSADIGGERDALERVQAAHLPKVDVSGLQSDTVSRLAFTTDGIMSQVRGVTRPVRSSYGPAYKAATTAATERVSQQASDARRSALLQIALIIALLALTEIAAFFLSRSLLVRPITGLRRSTIDASREHLPAAIERVQSGQGVGRIKSVALSSREEIGQLSRAVDDMQNRAIRLAGEQATLRRQMTDMFETLSRRSTSLVNQQLNLLEQLERSEDDPKRLDSLFRLDHMAARMRRNGQSLMVLAGNQVRGGRSESLPIAQVVGAAISEVQDYQRVNVGGLPDHTVDESVATDLVHLIAELVDNALTFSPPDSRVEISGARAIDGGVLVEIEDHGLGIEKDELRQLNEDITAGGRFAVDTTRHMGLFVVARLSANHDIDVRLRSRPRRGTVAAVHVPMAVLSNEPTVAGTAVHASVATEEHHELAPAMAAAPSAAEETAALPVRERPAAENPPARSNGDLPRRRPGATGVTSLTASASLGAAAVAAGTTQAPERSTGWVSPIGGAPTPDPDRASNASAFFSARQAVSDDAQQTTGLPQRRPGAARNGAESPADTTQPETQPVAQAAAQPTFRPEDTPIFRQISSRWLDADGEQVASWSSGQTDQAWEAAQVATDEHSSNGDALPQRSPGRFIVPGSVEQPAAIRPATPTRDPEELRAKLSRYKAGVERARQASASDDFSTDNPNHTDNGSRPW